MYTNQDILRLSTSHKIGTYTKGVNFMLLPMRIETKIMDKNIQKCHDVDKAFFLFKSIWNIVLRLKSSTDNNIEQELDTLEYVVGNLEILYKEDYTLLVSLLDRLSANKKVNKSDRDRLENVKAHLNDKTVMDAVKDNRATEVIKRYKRTLAQLKRTNECYRSISKDENNSWSKTAQGTYEYMRALRKWMKSKQKTNELLTKSNMLFKEIPCFNITQMNTLFYHLNQINKIISSEGFERIDFLERLKTTKFTFNGWLTKDFNSYIDKSIATASKGISDYNSLIESIKDEAKKKLATAKNGNTCYRYTQLAYMLTIWALEDGGFRKKHYNSLVRIATHTIFNFGQEQMWMMDVIKYYNSKASASNNPTIPSKAIFANNQYIRKHKMITNTKEKCLCVRIYPDELAVSQLRRELTPKEVSDASSFLLDYFRTPSESGISNPKQEAWDRLCKLYAPHRAAWIVRSTVQNQLWNNKDINNSKFIASDDPFVVPISSYLPERFFVQAALKTGRSECMLRRYGRRIPDKLQVGINMNQGKNFDPDKMVVIEKDLNKQQRIQLSENLRWMTDYNEAERKGMAISIPLSAFKYLKKDETTGEIVYRTKFKFVSIYVMGVKTNIDVSECEGSKMMCHLMEAQMFSEESMDIVKSATPTNILDNETNIPFDTSETAQSETFFNMLNSCLYADNKEQYSWKEPELQKDTDAYMLAKLFDSDRLLYNPLREVANFSQNDLQKARKANSFLLNELCNKLEPDSKKAGVLTYINTHSEVKKYFVNYVTARSFYPALRIGAQPYGILPVSDIKNLKLSGDMNKVQKLLVYLTEHWNMIARQNKVTNDSRDSRDFLELMGKTPVSSAYFKQFAVSIDNLLNPLTMRGPGFYKTLSSGLSAYLSKTLQDAAQASQKMQYIPLADENLKSELQEEENPLWTLSTSLQENLKKEGITVSQAEARRLVSEFFDLFTYRLDAWTQGLLFYQINERPRKQRLGIGAYGWVFDLDIDLSKNSPANLGEFLLAPSINQAITAGILRGAYKNSISEGSLDEAMNINLSSERVRKAKRIIEGLRNGLTLGTILGADGERLLHDAYKDDHVEMDKFIYPLRQRFPMYADSNKTSSNEQSSATINTFNGAQLIQELRNFISEPENIQNLQQYFSSNMTKFESWVNTNLPLTNTKYTDEQYKKLLEIFQQIYDSYDALTDIMLSEGVYQLSMGNTDNAAAIMNALNNETIPPMPQFTEIPIAHARIENRVTAFLEPTEPDYNIFHASQNGGELMSLIDVGVDKWIRSMLGTSLKMYEVGITPSEIIYLSSDADTFRDFLRSLSTNEYPAEILIEEFDSLEFIVETTRNLLGRCYGLKASDLVYGSYMGDTAFDKSEMDTCYNLLKDNIKNVSDFLKTITSTDDVINMLWVAFRLGITNAITTYNPETPEESVNSLFLQIDDKLAKAAKIVDDATEQDSVTADTYIQAIRALTVGNAIIAPTISIDPQYIDVNNLKHQLQNRCFANLSNNNYELDEWVAQMADIRPAINELQLLSLYGQCHEDSTPPAFTAIQLPLITDDNERILPRQEWLGIEVSDELYVKDANVYLSISSEHLLSALTNNKHRIKGLILDFWTEKIPLNQQTAGLAFNFDQPDAEAPQAILMAMPTSSTKNSCWSVNQLERSIKCALHLVKNRAVEPDHLQNDIWANAIFPLLNPLNLNKENSK